jgi:polyisoprenyl-phosphate glycosyltransferase
VDDGSSDASFEQLTHFARELARAGAELLAKVRSSDRHYGGRRSCAWHCVVVIDADAQDPPEVIVSMIVKWRYGPDIVGGVRSDRDGESAKNLVTVSAFCRLLDRMMQIDIPSNVGDFRLMSRRSISSANTWEDSSTKSAELPTFHASASIEGSGPAFNSAGGVASASTSSVPTSRPIGYRR